MKSELRAVSKLAELREVNIVSAQTQHAEMVRERNELLAIIGRAWEKIEVVSPDTEQTLDNAVHDLSIQYKQAETKIAKLKTVLERIGGPESCGCGPICHCDSQAELLIWKEKAKSAANEALKGGA